MLYQAGFYEKTEKSVGEPASPVEKDETTLSIQMCAQSLGIRGARIFFMILNAGIFFSKPSSNLERLFI